MKLLLIAAAGCTAIDVSRLLGWMKQSVEGLEVEIEVRGGIILGSIGAWRSSIGLEGRRP